LVEAGRKRSHLKCVFNTPTRWTELLTRMLTQDFLGRPPNSEAFLKELFGTVPASNL
jgi:hypothetical protein